MPRTSLASLLNKLRSKSISASSASLLQYSLSDDLKLRMSGEGEGVFRTIEDRFGVEILSRLPGLQIRALDQGDLQGAIRFLDQLKLSLRKGSEVDPVRVRQMLFSEVVQSSPEGMIPWSEASLKPILRNRFGQPVQAKTDGQAKLVDAIEQNDLVFVNGPAGTGKTFLAVALAVTWLEEKKVERICLVRPAVEAGENLGYLPGDLKEKIAPYLRPIYDTLHEMLPAEKLHHYHETGQIEIAPLAYMRGRTLKHAFIILDEAQNTTIPQMKMFLTRLGVRSKVIITGDSSQTDLDLKQKSGLAHAMRILASVDGISQIQFSPREVLRHRLVQDILTAYEAT